jgi:hypothetical protein
MFANSVLYFQDQVRPNNLGSKKLNYADRLSISGMFLWWRSYGMLVQLRCAV